MSLRVSLRSREFYNASTNDAPKIRATLRTHPAPLPSDEDGFLVEIDCFEGVWFKRILLISMYCI